MPLPIDGPALVKAGEPTSSYWLDTDRVQAICRIHDRLVARAMNAESSADRARPFGSVPS